ELLIEQLSRGGADKVVILTDQRFQDSPPPLEWGGSGPAIAKLADRVSPILLLFAATAGGREGAARAAARAGAAFLSDACLASVDGQLGLFEGAGGGARQLTGEVDFPVVATVRQGKYQPAGGDDEAEVEVTAAADPARAFQEIGWEADGTPIALPRCP